MGMNMLQYFTTRKWDFRSDKGKRIQGLVSKVESEIFRTELEKVDIKNFLKDCILGGRQFCLKEPLSTLPKARAQLKV